MISDQVESSLDGFGSGVKDLQAKEQQRQLRKWLSAPDPDTNLKKALDQHHDGTCLWFLKGEVFRGWLQGSRQHL